MANILYRGSAVPSATNTAGTKNAALTNLEIDQNFYALDSAKFEKSGGTISGDTTFSNNVTISGNLTVNGTTTTINTTNLQVSDTNIELGKGASPTDATANGGGITLLGATNKTITWDSTNSNWTSNQDWNIASGKSFKINNATVLSSTTLGSGVTSSSLTKLGTTAGFVKSDGSGNLSSDTNTYCINTDSRLSDSRQASDVYAWAKQPSKPSYTTSEVSESTSLYYTDVRARASISVTGSLGYNPSTGVISYTTPSSLPASDVYAWAKAATKPSYTKSEVGLGNVDNTADASKSVLYATTAGRAYPRRSDGGDLNFYWSGQSGQPTWVWGGSDGTNMYVYNPSNFSVNYANTAGYSTTARRLARSDSAVDSYNVQSWWDGTYWELKGFNDSTYHAGVKVAYATSAGSAPASDVYSWAKASSKPSYTKSEVGLGNVDNTADANKSVNYANSAGSAPASDVYSWAKQPSKPSYGASEVGALSTGGGTISGTLYIENSSPTVYFKDTDNRTAAIHCNSNVLYVLRGDGTNTTSWSQYNGLWPVQINLENNDFTSGGNVTAYSDVRLKENIITIDNALDKTLQLRGVYYNRIGESERHRVGVIAQEIKEVLPEVVISNFDLETKQDTLSVDYGNITALLIEAIKELNAKVEDLQNQLANK